VPVPVPVPPAPPVPELELLGMPELALAVLDDDVALVVPGLSSPESPQPGA
jgi:hypothetical protein